MIYRVSLAAEADGSSSGEAYINSRDEKHTVCVLTGICDRTVSRILNYGGWIERAVGEMLLKNAEHFMNAGSEKIIQEICDFMYSCIGFDVPENVTERPALMRKTWQIVLYAWETGKLSADEQQEWVEKRADRKLKYKRERKKGIMGRGNPLLARRKFRTLEDLDKKSKELYGL